MKPGGPYPPNADAKQIHDIPDKTHAQGHAITPAHRPLAGEDGLARSPGLKLVFPTLPDTTRRAPLDPVGPFFRGCATS